MLIHLVLRFFPQEGTSDSWKPSSMMVRDLAQRVLEVFSSWDLS